jgi:transposase
LKHTFRQIQSNRSDRHCKRSPSRFGPIGIIAASRCGGVHIIKLLPGWRPAEMAEPLSMDLRRRVLAAIAEGVSGRSAGRRFGVSASSVSRWRALERTQGDATPKPIGGDHRSHRTEAHAAAISSALGAAPDLTLEELREKLTQERVFVSYGALWRFLDRHKITRKKRPRTPASRIDRTS